MKIESLDIVLYTAIFLLPGFFMRNIISSLNPMRKASDNAAFLSYLMYSVINLALWSWVYVLVANISDSLCLEDWVYWVILVLITIIGATITSFIIGALIQNRFVRFISNILHLKSIDPTDTAWDWLFSKLEPLQLIITLKDNTEICGWYAEQSFSSSDPSDRDIYVQYIYKKDENGMYQHDLESSGIYIPKDSVKYIKLINSKEEKKMCNFNEQNSSNNELQHGYQPLGVSTQPPPPPPAPPSPQNTTQPTTTPPSVNSSTPTDT